MIRGGHDVRCLFILISVSVSFFMYKNRFDSEHLLCGAVWRA